MRKIVFDFNNMPQEETSIESEINKKTKKTDTKEIYEYINEVIKSQSGKVGLGVHAVRKEKLKDQSVDEVLKHICNSGLDIKKGSSVLATISSLGVSSEFKHHQKEALKNYRLGNEIASNGVIALVPTILQGNGEKLYVGFPGMDTSAVGNNHKKTCILDQICCGDNDYGVFPKEFILGYFKEENGEKIFQKNMNHFFEMNDEEKGNFIKGLSDRLTKQQKQISEAVINGDMQKLEQLSMEMYGNKDGALEENTIIQNAMLYLGKDRGQAEDKKEQIQEKTKKPRILFNNLCDDIKLSDLSDAKEKLREGIEQPEKNYEGKEV